MVDKRFDKDAHRGEMLAYEVGKSGYSVTWVTEKVGYKRGTYYTHVRKPDLSPAILEKYGKILGVDFSKRFSRKYKSAEDESFLSYEELKKAHDYWRNKYTNLVKDYDELKAAYDELKRNS